MGAMLCRLIEFIYYYPPASGECAGASARNSRAKSFGYADTIHPEKPRRSEEAARSFRDIFTMCDVEIGREHLDESASGDI